MIKSQADLKETFGVDDKQLHSLILLKAEYKRWQKPKKSGGFRQLTNPPEKLKAFQTDIAIKLSPYVDQTIARGGIKKQNRINAVEYVRQSNSIIKLDVKNCFPSIKKSQIVLKLKDTGFSHKYANLFAEIVTLDNCLPQGSPCSPCIANLVLNELDIEVINLLPKNAKCFRWIDDIIIGLPKEFSESKVEDFIISVRSVFQKLRYEIKDGLTIQPIRKEHANDILGLSISKKVNVNKKWYRNLRAQLNYFKINTNHTKEETNSIRGKFATLKQVIKKHRRKSRVQKISKILEEN